MISSRHSDFGLVDRNGYTVRISRSAPVFRAARTASGHNTFSATPNTCAAAHRWRGCGTRAWLVSHRPTVFSSTLTAEANSLAVIFAAVRASRNGLLVTCTVLSGRLGRRAQRSRKRHLRQRRAVTRFDLPAYVLSHGAPGWGDRAEGTRRQADGGHRVGGAGKVSRGGERRSARTDPTQRGPHVGHLR